MKLSFVKQWVTRLVLLLVGLTIAHLGVTLFLLADLGSDPFNVLIQGLHRFLPLPEVITHGTVHICVSLIIIIALLIIDRSYIRIGTVVCMFLGGPIIDMFTLLLQGVLNSGSSLWLRVPMLALGCVILAFGMTIVMRSEAGTGANDLVAIVISDKSKVKFGIMRVIVDVAFAGAGFLMGGTLGVGTVICAFLVGPAAQVSLPISQKICDHFLKNQQEVSK